MSCYRACMPCPDIVVVGGGKTSLSTLGGGDSHIPCQLTCYITLIYCDPTWRDLHTELNIKHAIYHAVDHAMP